MNNFNNLSELREYFNELHNCKNDEDHDEYKKAVEYELQMRKLLRELMTLHN